MQASQILQALLECSVKVKVNIPIQVKGDMV